jgi:hypothetical protein
VSTDWNVHCLDCKSTHKFDDANHMDDVMASLCTHAAAIAALAPLLAESRHVQLVVEHHGGVDAAWFVTHLGHRLVPISEYGDILGQCAEYVVCGCGSSSRCTRAYGHDGDHNPKAAR